MNKDKAILDLLAQLKNSLGEDYFQVVDNWEGDLCATGVAHPIEKERLVYISTYGKHGDYFASTESPNDGSQARWKNYPYIPGEDHDDISYDQLLTLIRKHLNPTKD